MRENIKPILFTAILLLIFGWFSNYPLIHFGGQGFPLIQQTAAEDQILDATSTPATELTEQEEAPALDEQEEAPALEDFVEPPPPPPQPRLKERKLNKEKIRTYATHRCEAETFSINISNQPTSRARIRLQENKQVRSGEIEIGSLPIGVDIVFAKNKDYLNSVSLSDQILDMEITNQPGSQKGNFSVPIIFTDKENNQTSVCQINIINF